MRKITRLESRNASAQLPRNSSIQPPRVFGVLAGLKGSLYKPFGAPIEPNPNFPPPGDRVQLAEPPALPPEQYVQISQLIRLYLNGNYPSDIGVKRIRSPSDFEGAHSSTPDLADYVSAEQVGDCLAALGENHLSALKAPEGASPVEWLEALDAFWKLLRSFL